MKEKPTSDSQLFSFAESIKNPATGIITELTNLKLSQLPLSQHAITVSNPIGEFLSNSLPKLTAAGLNHQESKREAIIRGLTSYVKNQIPISAAQESLIAFNVFTQKNETIKIKEGSRDNFEFGVGSSFTEAVLRAIKTALSNVALSEEETLKLFNKLQIDSSANSRINCLLNYLRIERANFNLYLRRDKSHLKTLIINDGESTICKSSLFISEALEEAMKEYLTTIQNKRPIKQIVFEERFVSSEEKVTVPNFDMPYHQQYEHYKQYLKSSSKELFIVDNNIDETLSDSGLSSVALYIKNTSV